MRRQKEQQANEAHAFFTPYFLLALGDVVVAELQYLLYEEDFNLVE